ncbi:MAG TPA: DUF1330 domain-containing protein [Candidatus Entotheonella sp.]|jgi:uncharacterized protein (DUF1330 family)
MAAYLIAQVNVTDPETFAQYSSRVPGVIEQYGGRYLVRGGATEAVEGAWTPTRLVVVEFPSMEQLKRFYHSDEYAPLIELRNQSARTDMTFAEGI